MLQTSKTKVCCVMRWVLCRFIIKVADGVRTMKNRVSPFLFSVFLCIVGLPMGGIGQEPPALEDDLAELLEVQLADVQQKNKSLAVTVEKQAAQIEALRAGGGGGKPAAADDDAALRRLEDTNTKLEVELNKLDEELAAVGQSRDTLAGELKAARKTLGRVTAERDDLEARGRQRAQALEDVQQALDAAKAEARKAREQAQQAQADVRAARQRAEKAETKAAEAKTALVQKNSKALADLKSSAIDEKRAKKLMADMEDMQAVDAQRKATLDDLFKQLAAVKRELKARDADIEALKTREEEGLSALEMKTLELQASEERVDEVKLQIADLQDQLKSQKELLKTAQEAIARKDETLAEAEAARETAETKLDRIQLTDQQRKRAMDDVLTRLAAAEKLSTDRADRIASLEQELERMSSEKKATARALKDEKAVLEDSVARLKDELRDAQKAQRKAEAQLAEHKAAAERDAARLVELESELARIQATDTQRRKTMDKLLLEMSSMEEARDALKKDLAEARDTLENMRSRVKPDVVETDVEAADALERLEAHNAALRERIKALEARLREAVETSDAPSSAVVEDREATELVALERTEWKRLKQNLEQEIALLEKQSKESASLIGELKADLTEAREARAQLADRVKQLQNRKIDVRQSDLFQEVEKVNVALREKVVQIENERQRLAKANKKLERRDARYDDEIEHEKELRRKAETELADARAREAEYKELIERLMAQVPKLEKQVTELEDEMHRLEQELTDREEDLRAMKVELEKREHRLIKAERVAEVLESAREDVLHASDREKLDMHYNMAAVYAREGKFEQAEREYLRALRLDPTDADVHYNLGILYDDELNASTKAAVHYRRYLKLNPHGPDADQVRDWLMKLEMKKHR